MKNIFLIILLSFCLYGKSITQIVWAPQSAKWTFGGQGIIDSYIEIEYEKDTIVLDKLSKVLSKKLYTRQSNTNEIILSNIGKEIIFIDDSVVFLYKGNLFDTLYSFKSSIGDSWNLHCTTGDQKCTAFVKDTGSIIINEMRLKYIVVEYYFGSLYPNNIQDTIIERIGATSLYFLPCDIIKSQLDGNEGSRLRCYYDEQIGIYSNHYNKPCDYLISNKQIEENKINIFPVPSSDFLVIELGRLKGKFLQIKDITGKIIITQIIDNKSCTIYLGGVPNGILLLEVNTNEGKFYKKIIKN